MIIDVVHWRWMKVGDSKCGFTNMNEGTQKTVMEDKWIWLKVEDGQCTEVHMNEGGWYENYAG